MSGLRPMSPEPPDPEDVAARLEALSPAGARPARRTSTTTAARAPPAARVVRSRRRTPRPRSRSCSPTACSCPATAAPWSCPARWAWRCAAGARRASRATRCPRSRPPTATRRSSRAAAAGAAFEVVRRVELLLDHWGLEPPGRAARRRAVGPRPQGDRPRPPGRRGRGRPARRGRVGRRPAHRRGSTTDGEAVWLPTDAFDAWSAGSVAERWAAARARLARHHPGGLASSAPATPPVARGTPWPPTCPARWPRRHGASPSRRSPRCRPARPWPPAPASRPWSRASRGGDPVAPPSTRDLVAWALVRGRGPRPHRARRRCRRPAARCSPVTTTPPSPRSRRSCPSRSTTCCSRPTSPRWRPVRSRPTWPGPCTSSPTSSPGAAPPSTASRPARCAGPSTPAGRRWRCTTSSGSVSRTPVPQPLTYLVDDVVAHLRHGAGRAGRGVPARRRRDARSPSCCTTPGPASLGLRRLAPTVLVSTVPVDVLLPRLRELGAAPVVEAPDGTVHVARRDLLRARRPRSGRSRCRRPRPDARRGRRRGDRHPRRRPGRRVPSRDADGDHHPDERAGRAPGGDRGRQHGVIGYVDNHGARTERVVDPVRRRGRQPHGLRPPQPTTSAPSPCTGSPSVAPLPGPSVDWGRGLHPVRRGVGGAAQRGPGRRRRPGGPPRRPRAGCTRRCTDRRRGLPCGGSSASCGRSSRPPRPATRRPWSSRLNDLLARHPITPLISDHDPTTCTSTSPTGRPRSPSCWSASRCSGLTTLVCDLGPTRLGVCRASSCTNVYVDTSPNQSRRYCSDRCSSRANVAAYRARQKAAAS